MYQSDLGTDVSDKANDDNNNENETLMEKIGALETLPSSEALVIGSSVTPKKKNTNDQTSEQQSETPSFVCVCVCVCVCVLVCFCFLKNKINSK